MIPDPTEKALADHLRRRSSRVVVQPDADALDAVVDRSARLGRRRTRRAAVSAVAAAAVAVAGVALVLPDDGSSAGTDAPAARTSSAPAPSTTQPDPAAGASVTAAPPLPFDLLPPTDDEFAIRSEAEHRLIGACLEDAGFGGRPFPDTRATPVDGVIADSMIRQHFGVFDESEVLEDGYRPQRWNLRAEREALEAEASDEPTFTEQYGADLLAVWSGCQFLSVQELRGGPQDMASPDHITNVVGELLGEADVRAEADDRIAAVVGTWSACMAGRGYEFTHPLDPVSAFHPDGPVLNSPLTPPGDDEVATGLADVACKAEVGFAATWYAVLAEHQQAVIDAHPAELQASADWHAGFLARAQEVLAGDTSPAP